MSRREFLQNSGAAAAALGLVAGNSSLLAASPSSHLLSLAPFTPADPAAKELAMLAIDAAKSAGASYADARISRNNVRNINTSQNRVVGLGDNETFGIGVRVLVGGSWGFAATSDLSRDEVARTAKVAVAQAKANRVAQRRPVTLAPVTPTPDGTWRSNARIDPFDVPIEEQVALLLAANEAALKVLKPGGQGAGFVNSSMFFLREEKSLATTDGTWVVQTVYRAQPNVTCQAVNIQTGDFQSRQSTDIQPMGRGYEHVLDGKLVENAPRWAEEAKEKLKAKAVEVGRYDLVLHPTHLWLTIHESVAHPTELDRALGFEANYAGTSFVAPPEKVLGKLRYGPEMMNIQADRDQDGSLGAIGWDDEGVKPDTYMIIKNGVVNDYQTTREQAPYLDWWYKQSGQPMRSHGNSYAQSFADVQFQRMPNVSLLPGTKEQSYEDLIAATDRGIAIVGDGSFSIDQQRYNAQFGGQLFYEIRGGKVVGMLKDVAYQMRTPEFWGGMDMIGGKQSYMLGGAFGDGKGQPAQSNAVSHGCPPTRHRNINVINTGRQA
ncbi:MAG: TldD/PmbA family protein [Phycisphaerae bacterium]|nr:TldD/PmbA family protein [Gemmatimonadaceae bacterium]